MNMFENSVGYVLVNQDRYDELLRKEALLDTVKKLCDRMSDYAVRDAIIHLLKTEVKADG